MFLFIFLKVHMTPKIVLMQSEKFLGEKVLDLMNSLPVSGAETLLALVHDRAMAKWVCDLNFENCIQLQCTSCVGRKQNACRRGSANTTRELFCCPEFLSHIS